MENYLDEIESLDNEIEMFAQFSSGLGYSDEQISDIATTGKLELDVSGLKKLINHQLEWLNSFVRMFHSDDFVQ